MIRMDRMIGANGRILTISYADQNGIDRPMIRIQGRWLEGLGFFPGAIIEVQEFQDDLLIKARKKGLRKPHQSTI